MSFLFDIASIFTYANQAGIAKSEYDSYTEKDPEKRKLAANRSYCFDKLNFHSLVVNLSVILIPIIIIMIVAYMNPDLIEKYFGFIGIYVLVSIIFLGYYNYIYYNKKLYELKMSSSISYPDCKTE